MMNFVRAISFMTPGLLCVVINLDLLDQCSNVNTPVRFEHPQFRYFVYKFNTRSSIKNTPLGNKNIIPTPTYRPLKFDHL